MFDKMVKMKNKKGFTLVEMLVVIAVVAILVSIVVPIISNSTQKSRAAANAANLRSIEGQISTMRVENPDLFVSAVDKLGQRLGGLANFVDIVMGMFGLSTDDLLNTETEFGQYVNYKVAHSTADENGTLTFDIGDGQVITIEGIPEAKGVSVPGMEVTEGTPMTVYLSDTEIMATYESGSNSFTRMDFAEVAETGEFTGVKGSGGLTEEDATGDLACAVGGQHTIGENCKCKYCGETFHSGPYTDAGANHTCDACDVPLPHTWSNGSCTGCNKTCAHGSWNTSDDSHSCTICGQSFSHTNVFVNASKHECSVCKKPGNHSDGWNGVNTDNYCDGNCGAKKTPCSCTAYKIPVIGIIVGNCTCSNLGHTHNFSVDGCEYATWTK